MFVNPGFEGLKIVSARKDGGREGVPVSYIVYELKVVFFSLTL